MIDIIEGMEKFCKEQNIKNLEEIRGIIQEEIMEQRVLELLKKVKRYQKDISYYHQENIATNMFNVQNF